MIELIGYVPVLVMNPASLLNHESCTDDDAIEFTFPVDPIYEKPCDNEERRRSDEKVDDAVEKIPPVKPRTDDVELPYDCEVNGNTCPASVEVAMVDTTPFDPMNEYPCVRSDSFRPFSVVDDSENRPDVNPITEVVELPYVCEVNGKAKFA